jgi:hypothetical protein
MKETDKIIIIDNFFDLSMFEKIKHHVTTKLYFTPKYFEEALEKNKDSYYGSRFQLKKDPSLLNTFIQQTNKKFNIKIKKIHDNSGVDIRNLDSFKPHVDSNDGNILNLLIMINGPTAVTNGTVFYTNNELDIHVGFRENRAVLFPSDKVHSPHASNVPNLIRHTATLFIQEFE